MFVSNRKCKCIDGCYANVFLLGGKCLISIVTTSQGNWKRVKENLEIPMVDMSTGNISARLFNRHNTRSLSNRLSSQSRPSAPLLPRLKPTVSHKLFRNSRSTSPRALWRVSRRPCSNSSIPTVKRSTQTSTNCRTIGSRRRTESRTSRRGESV